MADEKVKIAEIDIGIDKMVKKAGEAKKRIAEIAEEQKKLKKATNNLTNASEEQLRQFTQNDVEAKNLRKTYRDNTKVIDAYINIQNQDIRTKEQARNANSKLIAIANKLDATNEDQAETLKKINAEIDKNTDFIKENASQYERNKINIGNYKESVKQALHESGLFGEEVEHVTNIFQSFAPVFNNIRNDFKQGAEDIKNSTKATQGMTVATKAQQGATQDLTVIQKAQQAATLAGAGAWKIFRAAMLATGIGAFVVIFGSLVTYLLSTQEGIDKVNKFLAPTKEIFQALIGLVQNFGKKIFDAFSNPQKLIKDIGESIKQNLINRFTALGKIIDAVLDGDFKALGDGVLQATTGVENLTGKVSNLADKTSKFLKEAADRGIEMEEIRQRLAKTEAGYISSQAKLRKEFEQQKKLSEDVNQTQEVRQKAAERAIETQEEIRKGTVKRLELEAKLLKLQQQANDTSDSEKADLARKLAEIDKALEEEAAKTTEAQNKLNSIKQEGYKKQAELAQKALDAELRRNEIAIESYRAKQGFAAKTAQEELDLARKVYEKQLELEQKKLAAGKITQEELSLFILQNQNELAKMQAEIAIEIADRELEAFKKNHQSKIESGQFLNEQLFNQEQERLNRIAEAEREFQAKRLEQGIIDQQEYNDAIAAVNEESFQRQQELKTEREAAEKEQQAFDLALKQELENERFESQFELERAREQRRYEAELAAAERIGADIAQVEQKHANTIEEINQTEQQAKVAMYSDAVGSISKLLGEQTAQGKAFALAQALINTYQGITSALTLPFPANIAAAATTGATGFKAVKDIVKTKPPRAERGIALDINGRSHAQGGETFYDESGNPVVEAQGGEKMVILNRAASAELSALSALNQKHGGVSLSTPVTYANNGGAVIRRSSPGSSVKFPKDLLNYDQLGTVLADKVNAIQTVVPVDQINNMNNKNATVAQGANL
ncbi:hypothetical protein [uncultured Christiangramia sp.]|uniref:hypothetical protein n=1 Tax=uncultured Christiangramia sp. TaxID=503836 RepID=UPI0026149F1B|nr:hypothetical protein [uncultured Christiangramia sp.]